MDYTAPLFSLKKKGMNGSSEFFSETSPPGTDYIHYEIGTDLDTIT